MKNFSRPNLSSERLNLVPISTGMAKPISELLSDYEMVYLLTYAPWPYTLQDAAAWVAYVSQLMELERGMFWAIHMHSGEFIGTIGMSIHPEHDRAELHYWIGRSFWNHGYATEAAKTVIRYAFQTLHINRLEINHMVRNIQSKRVIEKCRFIFEGIFKDYVKRFGQFEDVCFYRLLISDFNRLYCHNNE